MNNIHVKKVLSAGLFTFAAAAFMLFGGSSAALADSNHHHHNHHNHNDHNHNRHDHNGSQPKINSPINTTATTAMVSFRDRKFRNQKVNVIVSVKEHSSGVLVEKAAVATLDGDGNGTVKVRGLKTGTDYQFKVRILKSNGDSTKNSSDKKASTT